MSSKNDLQNVVIGRVSSVQVSPPKQGYKLGSVFLRLEGNVLLIGTGIVPEDLPSVGSFAAFRCMASQSGKSAKIVGWGWLFATATGSQNKDSILSVKWVKDFGVAPAPSASVGMVE